MKRQIVAIAIVLLFCGFAISPCITGGSEVKIVSRSKESVYNIEDCNCEAIIDWNFPIICSILLIIYWIAMSNLPFLLVAHIIESIAGKIGGCPGIP